jgi:hypothetical protein
VWPSTKASEFRDEEMTVERIEELAEKPVRHYLAS